MAVLAVSLPGSKSSQVATAAVVLCVRDRFEMVRVHAVSYLAQMVEFHPIRDGSN